jgi:hypothetical protein
VYVPGVLALQIGPVQEPPAEIPNPAEPVSVIALPNWSNAAVVYVTPTPTGVVALAGLMVM